MKYLSIKIYSIYLVVSNMLYICCFITCFLFTYFSLSILLLLSVRQRFTFSLLAAILEILAYIINFTISQVMSYLNLSGSFYVATRALYLECFSHNFCNILYFSLNILWKSLWQLQLKQS